MAETVLNQQQEPKLDQPGADTQRKNQRIKRIVGVILSVVMIGLTVYVLHLQHQNNVLLSQSADIALNANDHAANNYRAYVVKYKETKIELDETTRKLEVVKGQLDQVSAELATTKNVLTQTQGMLVSAQEENAKLTQQLQVQGVDTTHSTESAQNLNDLQMKIQSLKEKDAQVSGQLMDLKNQLRAYEGDFSTPQEGQSLIILFKNKIGLVKSRLRYLKQEAFYAKIAAQKEKDRLAALNGNSGFVVRDGKLQSPDGSKKTFAIDVKIEQ